MQHLQKVPGHPVESSDSACSDGVAGFASALRLACSEMGTRGSWSCGHHRFRRDRPAQGARLQRRQQARGSSGPRQLRWCRLRAVSGEMLTRAGRGQRPADPGRPATTPRSSGPGRWWIHLDLVWEATSGVTSNSKCATFHESITGPADNLRQSNQA
jgi:hypothetical protein